MLLLPQKAKPGSLNLNVLRFVSLINKLTSCMTTRSSAIPRNPTVRKLEEKYFQSAYFKKRKKWPEG